MISAHLITEATAGSRPITLRHARQGLGNVEQALEQAHPEDDQPQPRTSRSAAEACIPLTRHQK
jgi:hypothetical protein